MSETRVLFTPTKANAFCSFFFFNVHFSGVMLLLLLLNFILTFSFSVFFSHARARSPITCYTFCLRKHTRKLRVIAAIGDNEEYWTGGLALKKKKNINDIIVITLRIL